MQTQKHNSLIKIRIGYFLAVFFALFVWVNSPLSPFGINQAQADVVVTAKGTFGTKDTTDPQTVLSSVTIADGASLIVSVGVNNANNPVVVTWNGNALNADVFTDIGSGGSRGGCGIYSIHGVTGGTGNIVISGTNWNGSAAGAVVATQVEGLLTTSTLDKTASGSAGFGGSWTAPDTASTATTAQADEFLYGAHCNRSSTADAEVTTNNGDTTTKGQRGGTSGQGSTSNATVHEIYAVVSSTGTFQHSWSGMDSAEGDAVLATYKAAPNVITISGTCDQFDQTTDCSDDGSNSIKVAYGNTLQAETDTTVDGSWSIIDLPKPAAGTVVTVFIDGNADLNEAAAVTKYSGSGNISGVFLFHRHLTIGNNGGSQTISNSDVGAYDNSVSGDEDIFFDTKSASSCKGQAGFTGLCVDGPAGTGGFGQYTDPNSERLYVVAGNTYAAGGDLMTTYLANAGTMQSLSSVYIKGSGTSTSRPFINWGTLNATSSDFYFQGVGSTDIEAATYGNSIVISPTLTTTPITYTTLGAVNVGVVQIIPSGGGSARTLNFTLGGDMTLTGSFSIVPTSSGLVVFSTSGSNHSLSSGGMSLRSGATFNANASTITVSGGCISSCTSNPFDNQGGTFNEGTSTFIYNPTGTSTNAFMNVNGETYYNLHVRTVTNNSPTVYLGALNSTINVTNDFTVGDGTNIITVQTNPNSPTITVGRDLVVNAAGILSGSGTGTITVNEDVEGAGQINFSAGTFNQDVDVASKTFGTTSGSSNWIFNNLTFSNAAATNFIIQANSGGTGTITIAGVLTIGDAGDTNTTQLNASSRTWTLSGSGTPFVITATKGVFTRETSVFQYTGTSATTITATPYYGLSLIPAATVTYTIGTGSSFGIVNLIIGNGTNAVTLENETNDINISIINSMVINANAIFTKSSTGVLNIINTGAGNTVDFTDNTASKQDLGAVNIAVNGANSTLRLNSGMKVTTMTVNISQALDLNGNTLTLTGTGTPLNDTIGDFFITNSTVVYTGSTATVAIRTFNNLTLGGTGTYTLPENTVTLRGSLTVASSANVTKSSAGKIVFASGSTQTITDSSGNSPDLGPIQVSALGTNTTLNLGSSVRVTTVTIDASQTLSLNGSNTLTITGSGTTTSRPLINNGTFTASTGTVNYVGTATTDIENITYNNLGVGTTSDSSAISYQLRGATTAAGTITIGNASSSNADTLTTTGSNHALNAGAINITTQGIFDANGSTVTLTGGGTPLTISGTFTVGTSTLIYNSTTATNIAATNYNNLTLAPNGGGSPVYTTLGAWTFCASESGDCSFTGTKVVRYGATVGSDPFHFYKVVTTSITCNNASFGGDPINGTAKSCHYSDLINGNLVLGNGTNAVSIAANTNTTPFNVIGNMTINANTTYTKGGGTIFISGTTQTLTDNTSGQDLGHLHLSPNTTNTTLNLGSSIAATSLGVESSQSFNFNGSNTLTLSGTGTPLDNDGSITISTGTFAFTGSGANVQSTTYNNLSLLPAGSAQVLGAGTLTVQGNLIIGNGTNSGATAATNNPNITLGGNLTIAANSTFTKGAGTFTFAPNGTKTWTDNTSGQDIGTVSIISGASAQTINLGSSVRATKITISSGHTLSLNGANTLTLTGTGTAGSRPLINSGTFTASTGTVNYIGTSATEVENVTYNNLGVGTSSDSSAVSYTLRGTTTASGTLTIGNASSTNSDTLTTTASNFALNAGNIAITSRGALTANASTVTISGSGSAFTNSGTFTPGSSTVSFTGTSATTVPATTFNHLTLAPSSGSPTYTLGAGTLAANNLTLGSGNNLTVTAATNNPTINVTGNLSLGSSTTFTKGNGTLNLRPVATKTLTDSNSTKQDLGIVTLINGTSTPRINLASSVRMTSLNIAGSHQFDFNGSNTLTLTGNSTPLVITGTFTRSTGTVAYTNATSATLAATTYNNLNIGAGTGTFTMPGSAINIGGNLVIASGSSVTKGAGAVTFNKGGGLTQTWTDSNGTSQDIGAVTVAANGGTTTLNLASNVKATSVTVNASQTLSLNGSNTLSLTGNSAPLSVSGTFTASTGTVSFDSSGTTGTTIPNLTYYNLTANRASNTFTAPATLSIGNNLAVSAGTLDMNTNDPAVTVPGTLTIGGTLSASNSANLTIGGNFTNNGTFTHNSGTVVAAPDTGSSLTIGGSAVTTFNNFTATTGNTTIQFKANQNVGFAGAFTVTGSGGNPIYLYSDSPGAQWDIVLSGTASIFRAVIRDAGCGGGTNTISPHENSVNAGNVDSACWKLVFRGAPAGATGGGAGGGAGSGGGGSSGGGGGTEGGAGGGAGSGGGDEGGAGGGSP